MAGRRRAGGRPLAPKGTLRLYVDQLEALQAIQAETGEERSELIRRAVDLLTGEGR